MTPIDDLKSLRPGRINTGVRSSTYCIRDHEVLWAGNVVRGANPKTFEYYTTGYAKDHKACYLYGRKLRGGNGKTFRMLNYTYATDGIFVWTVAGAIKDVDPMSFEVCDSGAEQRQSHSSSSGYSKDKKAVYFYCGYGKNKILTKADPATFVSNMDGCFARDAKYVFYHQYTLTGCNPAVWGVVKGLYSGDGAKIYHRHKRIRHVDSQTFEVSGFSYLYAKDKDNFYRMDELITKDEFYNARTKELERV